MREVRVALIGYGGVGQAFASALDLRAAALKSSHDLSIELVAVRRASIEASAPTDRRLLDTWEWTPNGGLDSFIERAGADIIVQAVPSAPDLTETALEQATASLVGGAHFVTATKSLLTTHWRRLEETAMAASRAIRVSAAAGAGLPAVDLARRGLRGFSCIQIRGSLNGTSNAVLTELADGTSLAESIAMAVATGIAEPDPGGDLSGADAAGKMIILANLVWGTALTHESATIEPITESTVGRAQEAARRGQALRSVATASAHADGVRVSLESVGPDDPLYRLTGAEKAVEFDCGLAGSIVVSGGRSSSRAAGLALLKDVINVSTGDASPGFR